jgi:hypothetical protein
MHFVGLVKRQVSPPPGTYLCSEAKHNVNVHTYTYKHIHTNTERYIQINHTYKHIHTDTGVCVSVSVCITCIMYTFCIYCMYMYLMVYIISICMYLYESVYICMYQYVSLKCMYLYVLYVSVCICMYVPKLVNLDTYRYIQIHTIHTDTYICIWGGDMHTICIVHMLYVCLDEIHTYTYNTYMQFQIHTRYAHAVSLMILCELFVHQRTFKYFFKEIKASFFPVLNSILSWRRAPDT